MNDDSFDRRDPGEILTEVAKRHSFRDGEVLLVLVRAPYRGEDVVEIVAVPRAEWSVLDQRALTDLLAASARAMPIPAWTAGPPQHEIMTVVPRRGFAIIGVDEQRWLEGWYYSNHAMNAFTSDLAVVTEHGWTEFMSAWGGSEPRLELGPRTAPKRSRPETVGRRP